jgi:hypothetical protein
MISMNETLPSGSVVNHPGIFWCIRCGSIWNGYTRAPQLVGLVRDFQEKPGPDAIYPIATAQAMLDMYKAVGLEGIVM